MSVNHSKAHWADKPLCGTKGWKRASWGEEVTCKRCNAICDSLGSPERSDAEQQPSRRTARPMDFRQP